MAARGPSRGTTVFAAIAAALVTTYFAFLIFAAWVTLQYGVKNTDFGWEVQRLGENLYISGVAPMGPAAGGLEPGDRLLSLNGEALKTDAALSLALRSVAGASLYSMKVQRGGKMKDVFLRAGTQNGVSFFRERLPLLGSSLLMFLAGLAMLLNWNSMAARFGFAAAMAGALRMGAWALLPLSGFFRTQEFHPYFVFWLPVPLGLPLAYESVMRFAPRRETGPIFRAVGWVLLGACASILLMILYTQTVPAPVPEGVAYVQWDGVNYTKNTPASQVGMPLLLVVMLVATAFWIWELYRTEADGDVRRRLLWLMGTGLFFAVPGVMIEVYQWVDGGNAAVRHSWLLSFALLAYSYLLTAERVTHPATVVRAIFGALLPRPIFRRFDRRYFPKEAKIEERLEAVISAVSTGRSLEALQSALTRGIEYALEPAYLGVNPEASLEDLVELGPKKNGEPFTRREKRLVQRAALAYQRTEKRIRETPADASLDLLRECPSCGACYGSDTIRCVHDGAVPSVNLPIERLIEGKYFLERRIGRGGMGAVYVAKDRRLGRKIAIKVMLSELFGHQGALRRFEREAQAAARLNHANVVQIYDYGPIGKMGAFLVMEYVEGRSWREELQANGAIKAGVCIPWIEQLLDGVQAAHSAGIIHRDLKPENLLLAERAIGPMQLKILDFGLAKMHLLSFSREEKISIDASTIGTVGYVPPEQLVGGAVDERSDIYAIGRVVLETITGALPDAGIVGVNGNLYKVLQKCVSPVKEDRYGSIAELRTELLPALEALGSALHK